MLYNSCNLLLHRFILNKDNKISIYYDNKKYVLFHIYNDMDNNITIDDLNEFRFLFNNNYINSNYISDSLIMNNKWRKLWMNKIDYYEYEIENYKSYNFYEVFDYFIGLTEIGIQLLYFYNYNNNFFISHKRVSMSMKKRDLYNPLNIVIDKYERDYAEYYKDVFFKGNYINIMDYIKNNNIEDLYLFFVRLLYITPFFDSFDEIIRKNSSIYNKKIERVINSIDLYVIELKKLYKYIYMNNNILYIEYFSI